MNEPNSLNRAQAPAVVMVRPAGFCANVETGSTNVFQSAATTGETAKAALYEFDGLVNALNTRGVAVLQLDGSQDESLPDEVFPNNWFSTHADGSLVLYPMAASNRRRERRADLQARLQVAGYRVQRRVDLTHFERVGQYLEGTGSLVIDYLQRQAFVCRSTRSDAAVATAWCELMGFRLVMFDALLRGQPVYHTNVVMALSSNWAVWAQELVPLEQRKLVHERLTADGRDVIDIDVSQVGRFCGNVLGLEGRYGAVIALSAQALQALRPAQIKCLEAHGELVAVPIPTIEAVGGGGVRCMLAELHLPRVANGSVCQTTPP